LFCFYSFVVAKIDGSTYTILRKESRHHETFTLLLNHDYAIILFRTIRTALNIVKITPSRLASRKL
jgi:hypothetical protein